MIKPYLTTNQLFRKRLFILTRIIISGLCWYLSVGLTGDYWYLLWIAPIPIIYLSIQTTRIQTFYISFVSYLIGRLSWFSYLVSVVTLIPSLDSGVDDWLHSRMAMLRGVENGFSEIRTAREGRLTISDCFGRVNYESSCSKGQKSTMAGDVSLLRKNTIYTRFGDWFGMLILIVAISFILLLVRTKNHIK